MTEIIKYQLKGRKGAILLILAIFGILNLIAFALEISGLASGIRSMHPELMFWVVIACMATVIITVVMFFMCSSGHVNDLLYKDTSYLMLTVPRHGWEILGGRFIAGLAEFAVYFVAAGFLASVHCSIITPLTSPEWIHPVSVFAAMYEQIFFVNFLSAMQVLVIGICLFTLTGMLLTFAVVASRSFVKNRGIATAIAIAVFFMITNWAGRFGASLSEKWNWYWNINFTAKSGTSLFLKAPHTFLSVDNLQGIPIPVAPIVLGLVLAAALFAASSWLMEKKVEL